MSSHTPQYAKEYIILDKQELVLLRRSRFEHIWDIYPESLSLKRCLHFVQFKLTSYQGCIYICLFFKLSLNLFLGLWCGGIPVFSSPKESYFGILLIILHTTRSFNRIWLNIIIILIVLHSYIWQKTVSGTEDLHLMLRRCIRHFWRNH